MRSRLFKLIIIVQVIIFAAHWLVYQTWIAFQNRPNPSLATGLMIAMAILSVTFVPASLLGFRYSNFWTRLFYKFSAVWLGMLNYLVLAAFLCSVVDLGGRLIGSPPDRPALVAGVYGLAIFTGVCGIINARRLRVKHIKVSLPNLPQSWRGRVAALVSDLHLGQVNGRGFIRKVVTRLRHLDPDVFLSPATCLTARTRASEIWQASGNKSARNWAPGSSQEITRNFSIQPVI